jgi:hypothetical protein
MHMQHATYGHPEPPCSRRGCVFPYDLVRREPSCRASKCRAANLPPIIVPYGCGLHQHRPCLPHARRVLIKG